MVNAGGTFDLNGHRQTIGSLSGTGGVVALGIGKLTVGDSRNTTFGGSITGDGGKVNKTGPGRLTLSGVSTFSGGLTINGGAVRLGVDNALLDTGALRVNTGGTFDLDGHSPDGGELSGTGGAITLRGGTLTAGNAANATLVTAITGDGTFIKQAPAR
jgi:autotransporter-associated beta strand protein